MHRNDRELWSNPNGIQTLAPLACVRPVLGQMLRRTDMHPPATSVYAHSDLEGDECPDQCFFVLRFPLCQMLVAAPNKVGYACAREVDANLAKPGSSPEVPASLVGGGLAHHPS